MSVHAIDMEASIRFYVDVFGMEQVPSPDFEAVYLKATELGVLDRSIAVPVRELPGGEVQMYLRDPAGNLVEVDWPDAATLDRSTMGEIPKLADFLPQSEEALEARLYRTREAAPLGGGGE